jgi:phenylalanyl-tRNA synthetase beta chain
MKACISWLNDLTPVRLTPDEIKNAFTNRGLEVVGITGQYKPLPNLVVGEVLACEKHPNADRLSCCRVDTGEVVEGIVCGAPNVRPGLKVVVAKIGAELPNGIKIKNVAIRGVNSRGMLCSGSELQISEDSAGIIELETDARPGTPVTAAVLGIDPVIDVGLTPNRGDCLSILGLARELAALQHTKMTLPQPRKDVNGAFAMRPRFRVEVEDGRGCPRYALKYLRQVKISPSPRWLAKRLQAVGIRPINNLVDITNYVMMELGHPMHAFDCRQISGGTIIVKRARDGEVFAALDQRSYTLNEEHLLICDNQKTLALAGIIGGRESEISADTTEVLLECACFEPVTIQKGRRQLGIFTESCTRFEKGVDPNGIPLALARAVELMVAYGQAEPCSDEIDVYPAPVLPRPLDLRVDRVNQVLGTSLTAGEIRHYLETLHFTVKTPASGVNIFSALDGEEAAPPAILAVEVPTFRTDVTQEIDLVEEVCRSMGLDKIPAVPAARVPLNITADPELHFERKQKEILTGIGFVEVWTNSLENPEEDKLVSGEAGRCLRLVNGPSPEMSALRTQLLPSLLRVVGWNVSRRNFDLGIYEVGNTFTPDPAADRPRERRWLAASATGSVLPRTWGREDKKFGFYGLKGVLEHVLHHNKITNYRFAPLRYPDAPEISITIGDQPAGRLLQVPEDILDHFNIRQTVVAFELDLAVLQQHGNAGPVYKPLAKVPPVFRDFAVVVRENVAAGDLLDTIRGLHPFVEDVFIFDVFRSAGLGADLKSIALSVRLQNPEQTLQEAEIEKISGQIIDTLGRRFGATLR